MKFCLKYVFCFFTLLASNFGQAVYLYQWTDGKRDHPLAGPQGCISSSTRLPVAIYGSMIVSRLGLKKTDDRSMLPQASSFSFRPESAQARTLSRTVRPPVILEGSHIVYDVSAIVAARKPKK